MTLEFLEEQQGRVYHNTIRTSKIAVLQILSGCCTAAVLHLRHPPGEGYHAAAAARAAVEQRSSADGADGNGTAPAASIPVDRSPWSKHRDCEGGHERKVLRP